MPNGCLAQIESCRAAAANGEYNYSTPISSESDPAVFTICSEAQSMCRDNVEGVYYS
jgi:carboxypeptidase D